MTAAYGLEPVAIETTAGKTEFVHRQRDVAHRGTVLRERLLNALATAGVKPVTLPSR